MADDDLEQQEQPRSNTKDRRARRKRLVRGLSISSVMMLLMSVVLVVLFFVSTEPKGTEHPQPVRPELPTSELSVDLRPYDRWLLKQEQAELMEGTVVRQADLAARDDDTVWIYDATTPLRNTASEFYVYIGETFDGVSARLRIGATSENPVHSPCVFLNVDGMMYTIEIDEPSWNDVELPHVGKIHEFADVPLDKYEDELRHVGYGANVLVSLRSDEGALSFRLTDSQVAAVSHMMHLLRVKQLLYKDGVEVNRKTAESER